MRGRAVPSTAIWLTFVCSWVAGCQSTSERLDDSSVAFVDNESKTFNVMAPLVIGNTAWPDDPASAEAWQRFRDTLGRMKQLGADAVSTDVWWGLIEPNDDQFRWDYYDKMAGLIVESGLRWVPILSFHQCGGNVGDECDIPLPDWVWGKYQGQAGGVDNLRYKSEQGNVSKEYIAAWATDLVLPEYETVMRAFQGHFASRAGSIAEINISLGPAGELRYPSYNSHDQGSGYPTRGALQAYSDRATEAFRNWASARYGGQTNAKGAWGAPHDGMIFPPLDANSFFAQKDSSVSQYGRDFIDFYGDSLIRHGKAVMLRAIQVFNDGDAPFRRIDLGAKVPGVHWRMGTRRDDGSIAFGDRFAEQAAGLIRTADNWDDPNGGRGYRRLIRLFRELGDTPGAPKIVLHFTCLEMNDGNDGPEAASLARTLVDWIGEEAARQGVPIKGENALAGNLAGENAWDNMRDAVFGSAQRRGHYQGLTILRMSDIAANPMAASRFASMSGVAGQQ